MKTYLVSVGAAFAVALAAGSIRAQGQSVEGSTAAPLAPAGGDPPSQAQPGGLLGSTYLSTDANLERFRNVANAPEAFGPSVGANLPFAENLDYSLNYGFEHASSRGFQLNENDFGNGVTTFYRFGHISPYASAGLDYDWERLSMNHGPLHVPTRFDRLDYDFGGGLELPLTEAASLRAGIGQDEASLRRPHTKDWDYDFSANYWLGSVVGTFVGAEVKNGEGGALDSTVYTVGLKFLLDSD